MVIVDNIRPQVGPQERFLESPSDICIYGGSAGGGKMLSVDTVIPTPDGWVKMGDIKQGDQVFSEKGAICIVTAAHPIITPDSAYKLTFDDGSCIVACGEHQWWTYTAKELGQLTRRTDEYRAKRREKRLSRKGTIKSTKFSMVITKRNKELAESQRLNPPKGMIRTTSEIYNTLLYKSRRNHAVRVTEPLILLKADLLIDPYLLGAWLGDGTSSAGAITTADREIIYEFEKCVK